MDRRPDPGLARLRRYALAVWCWRARSRIACSPTKYANPQWASRCRSDSGRAQRRMSGDRVRKPRGCVQVGLGFPLPGTETERARKGGSCPVLDDWDHLSLRRSPSLVCLFRPRQRPILWTAGRSRSHGAKCLFVEATSTRISSADTTASYSRGLDGGRLSPQAPRSLVWRRPAVAAGFFL